MDSIYNNIPAELRDLPQWVTHKAKIPYQPRTGEKAKSGEPSTWDTYAAALEALQSGLYDGLGFEFHNNGIIGVDLDKAVDDNGQVKEWATKIVELLDSYTEYSISGKGLHIFVKADIPVDGRKKKLSEENEGIELYKARRYFAMTGNVYKAVPIANRQSEIDRIYNKYFPAVTPKPEPPKPPPPEIGGKDYLTIGLEKDRKFRAIWDGQRPKEDESANDMSLMNKLAYWCNRDIPAMIAAFMRSPYAAGKDEAHRAKLERADYLERTAKEAADKMGATAVLHDREFMAGRKNTAGREPGNNPEKVKPDDYTDTGNADIFVRIYKNKAVFLKSMGWLVWNGKNWDETDLGALRLAIELTALMLTEARQALRKALGSKDKDETAAAKAYFRHVLTSRNQPHVDNILDLAKSKMAVLLEDLDSDPHVLNTPAGMVDLRTGAIKPHDPVKLCTKITKCPPGDKGADEWQEFLKTITCGDDSLINFLQQIAGMAAVGRVYMENLVIAYGDGNNGKSTFFNTIRTVLGTYAGSIAPEVLTTQKQNKGADYAELKGKRLVIAAELDEGTRLSTKALKQLSSTDNLTAEKKYKQPEDFIPTHSLILFTNHLPRVGSTDSGTWRRILAYHFKANIDMQIEVKNYAEQLYERCGEAVLSWIIAGAVKFCKAGHTITPPEAVKKTTAAYKEKSNWTREFLDDCCEVSDTSQCRAGELYTAYRAWAQNSGEYIRNKTDFVAELERQGFDRYVNNKGTYWIGISIIERMEPQRRYNRWSDR